MNQSFKGFFSKKTLIIITIILFALYSIWWLFLLIFNHSFVDAEILWMNTYQFMALWGGILGFIIASNLGGFKKLIARSIIFLSLGLIFQFIGGTVFGFYNIWLKVEVPYPSLADIGFFGSIPLFIYGVWLLGKSSGVVYSFKNFIDKVYALLIPSLLISISYFSFLYGYRFNDSSYLKIFLDFAYPIGEAIYVSLAILVYLASKKIENSFWKNKTFLVMISLVTLYVADYNFIYQVISNTWKNGSYGDLIYFLSQFVMTLAIINLGDLFNEENKLVIKKTFLYAFAVGVLSWIIFAITFVNEWFLNHVIWARVWMIPIFVSGISILIFYIIWRQLERSDRARYEFITIATHKFRTPLTRIKHGVDLLLDELNQATDKNSSSTSTIRNRELLERLKKDNLELIELTSIMLRSHSKNTHNKNDICDLDIADTFFNVINSNRHNFDSKNIKVISDGLSVPQVKVEPNKIKSLVEILVDNALHYTYKDGEVYISATYNNKQSNITCSIANTGIPITSSDKKKIFESFYRTKEAKEMNTEGTGLGLFLAKKIVEMHGGRIWVEDLKNNTGVKFIFTLPL